MLEYLVRRRKLHWALGDWLEALIDRAEAALFKAVKAGDSWAIKFMINTLGRTMGYSDYARVRIRRKMPDVKDAVHYKRLNSDELIEIDNLEHLARGLEPFDPWMKVLGKKMPPYNDQPKRLD